MAKPINVVIKGDYTDRDINRAIADLNRLRSGGTSASTGMAGLAGTMKNVLGPALIGASAAAGAMAVAFGVDAVKAFIDDERAAATLSRTLRNLGLAEATTAVEGFIDAQQRATGVSDEQLRPAMDRLLRSTRDVKEAQELLSLSLDISAGSGKSLEAVSNALARAADGNTGALGRLGTGLDQATLKSKDFDRIVGGLSQTFKGQAAEAANTLSGDISQLGIAFDELKESFGRGFIKGLEEAAGSLDDVTTNIQYLEAAAGRIGEFIGKTAIIGLKQFSAAFAQMAQAIDKVKKGDFLGAIQTLAAETSTFVNDFSMGTFGGGNNLVTAAQAAAGQFEDARRQIQQTTDATRQFDDQARRTSSSGSKAAEDLAIKWKQAAAEISADIEGLKLSFGGGGTVIAGGMVEAFQSRLDSFRSVVNTQVGIVKQATDALDSYAKAVSDTVLGNIQFSMTGAEGQPLTPEQVVQMVLGDIEQQGKAVQAISQIATKIPEALAQQILTLPPDAAIGLANYLANNPAQLEQLNTNYQALALTTQTLLGIPMAEAFAIVGDQSAVSMIQSAKEKIAEESEAFRRWVQSKLKTRITVEVEYRAVNVVAGASLVPRAEGGPVGPGTAYLVGEQGPEVFVPKQPGVIVPNDSISGGGSPVATGGSTFVVNISAGIGDPRAIGREVVEAITLYERASGPVFARA
jgi:hypothetical protein